MSGSQRVIPDLAALSMPFFAAPEDLGQFEEVTADTLPEAYRTLLANHDHMTIALERHHGSPVDVRVLATHTDRKHYARQISLTRQSDNVVVLTGIMGVNLKYFSDNACDEIRDETIPLGRVLIAHNVMRKVEMVSLYCVTPGESFRSELGMAPGETTFGRTALIHVDGEPAIELLEIVAPMEDA